MKTKEFVDKFVTWTEDMAGTPLTETYTMAKEEGLDSVRASLGWAYIRFVKDGDLEPGWLAGVLSQMIERDTPLSARNIERAVTYAKASKLKLLRKANKTSDSDPLHLDEILRLNAKVKMLDHEPDFELWWNLFLSDLREELGNVDFMEAFKNSFAREVPETAAKNMVKAAYMRYVVNENYSGDEFTQMMKLIRERGHLLDEEGFTLVASSVRLDRTFKHGRPSNCSY